MSVPVAQKLREARARVFQNVVSEWRYASVGEVHRRGLACGDARLSYHGTVFTPIVIGGDGEVNTILLHHLVPIAVRAIRESACVFA